MLDFLFRGENITLLVQDLKLKGGNGWANVIVPLGKALGVELVIADTAVGCVRSLLNGILGLVDDLGDAPINTIINIIAGLSYFIASDGVEEAVNGILAPITGFLGLLEAVIGMDDINALLKGLIGMSLEDIAGIAGNRGETLVKGINNLINGLGFMDTATGETTYPNLLPENFFYEVAQYAIEYNADDVVTLTEGQIGYNYQPESKHVSKFTVDGSDGLMYVLSTVCSDEFLESLCGMLNVKSEDMLGGILLGLAGKQDSIVDIILTLVERYTITYSEYHRESISKKPVTHHAPMTEANLSTALKAIDEIVAAVIPMFVKDADGNTVASLKALVAGLLDDLNVADLLMGILVPALAGLDINAILGYVNDLTNLDVAIDPQTFVKSAKFGSALATFIGDAKTWAEVRDARFTMAIDDKGTEDTSDDATTYTIKAFDWNLGLDENFNGLVNLICDLLMPLDQVFELLLCGEELIVLEDKTEPVDDIRIVGGKGYNYAIIPLLEALGIDALSVDAYEALAKEKGHLYPVLSAIIGKVETILDAPVANVLGMLANLFYFIGTDGVNNIASNLLAFANYLLKKIDPVFHIGVKVDLSAEKIFEFELGDEADKNVPAGVNINVDPDDLVDLVNNLLDGLKLVDIDGDGEKDPLGLALNIDWLDVAAQMAAADENGAIITKTTAQTGANWYNIKGDAEDTFTTLLDVLLSQQNTVAIAKLVEGLLGDALNGMDGVDENGQPNNEINVKGILNDVLQAENGLKELIAAVVLFLSGQYTIESYSVIYKYLGALTFFAGEAAGDKATLNTAIERLDSIITREAVELIPMFIKEDATGIVADLRAAAVQSDDLGDMIDYLLGTLLFTEANYDKLIGILVKAISGFLSADLCGTLNTLLGIDLAPAAFAAATGNADIIAYVGTAATWADVWAAHSDAEGNAVAYEWNITDEESFIDAVLALLKPLDPVLDFILANGSIKLLDKAISLPGGDAYNKALVPLFKALGVDLEKATTSSEAIGKLVNGILGNKKNAQNDGLVEKLGVAPLKTILELVAGLSYLLANDNLEPIIKNLLAPVFSILELLEPVISREQLDDILKSLINIGGKQYGLTDLIEIGNNGGANLVELINGLIGGFKIYDKSAYDEDGKLKEDAKPVDVLNLLQPTFFTDLSKYAVDVTAPTELKENKTEATDWTYDAAETLMFILDTALSESFLKVLGNMIAKGEETTLTTILTGLADKEMSIVELILMLLDNYTISYTKIPQSDLANMAADYTAFGDNTDEVKAALPDAITALNAVLETVLGLLGQNSDLGALIDGLIAGADLGKLIMNLLVPALAGINLDDIIGYVNSLTNLDLHIDPQTFATSAKFGSTLADFIGDAETWADVRDARFTLGEDGKYTMNEYDFGLTTIDAVVNFAADLLIPLDVVFQVLLSGKQIIALEDEIEARRADIRINGGYGYNYAIIPLLEALGVDALSQTEYDARVIADGSSLKYILDAIVSRVDEILAAPISEVLGLVANLFYFIGSEGINSIVNNLVAPVVELLDAVCEVYPISVYVGVVDGAFKADFDIENKKGLEPGFVFDLSAESLNALIGGLLSGIKINGEALGLTLDLKWNELAAQMAEKDANGNIIYSNSAMVYGYKNTEMKAGEGNAVYKNITGNAADTLVTLLNAILTEDNAKVIKNLVLGLLGDTELGEELEGLINNVLGDSKGLVNLVGTVVLILTGKYSINTLEFVFKFLGDIDYDTSDADTAIETLDRLVGKALPAVLPLIAGENTDPESLMGKISAAANNVPAGTPVLTHIINTLLDDMLFTQDMMDTISGLVVGTIGGFLSESLCGTLKNLLGIDLSPAAFAAASGNNSFVAYVNVAGTGTDGAVTWADVIAAHKHTDDMGTEDTADDVVTYDPIFTSVDTKEEFLGNIFDILQAIEPVLAFLLTGGNLNIAQGYGVDNIMLKGNAGYNNAIKHLFKGLGLDQMGATWKTLADGDDAVDALRYTIDYVLALVDSLGARPFNTILTLVSNISYLIASGGVEVILSNLLSPVLSLLDALSGTISRAELDALLASLTKSEILTVSGILGIANNNGKALVDLINGLLPAIEIYDPADYKADGTLKDNAKPIKVVNALPDTFFIDLAKAAVEVKEFADPANTAIGSVVKSWNVNTGDALVYVLKTVLTNDFLTILCKALKVDSSPDNMVYGLITSLAGKDEAVLDVLLSLLVKYLVEYKSFNSADVNVLNKNNDNNALAGEDKDEFDEAIANLDAIIPAVLGLIMTDENGNAKYSSLEGLVTDLIANADLGKVLMNLLVPLLADLDISAILGYVNTLTNLEIDLSPAAFAKNGFGSKLAEFIGNAETWADVRDVRFTKTVDNKDTEDESDDVVTYTINEFDFGVDTLDDLVKFVCDLTAPLDQILALILMGGQKEADFIKSGETSVGKSLSVLDEINVMGGMGYNYAIIPLLEILGIDAMSQEEYLVTVENNHGSTLYPILSQLISAISGPAGLLANPVDWIASILANLAFALANDDITTIIDNLIAPINQLIVKVDKIVPIAIDINIADIGNETENNKVVDLFIAKAHPGVDAGIHVHVSGAAVSALIGNLLKGIKVNNKPVVSGTIEIDWMKMAAQAGADANGDGKVDFEATNFSTEYDIYNGAAYKTIKGNAADTILALITTIRDAVDIKEILSGLNLGDTVNGIITQVIENPETIIDLLGGLFSKPDYQPVQNSAVYADGINYNSYLTFTEQNADIIARDLDGLVADILKAAGFVDPETNKGSLRAIVADYISAETLNSLLGTIFGLLAGESVAGILDTVKSLIKVGTINKDGVFEAYEDVALDLSPAGFRAALDKLDLNGKHSYLKGFRTAIDKATTWAEVDTASITWSFAKGDVNGFVQAIAGVLTPLNDILRLLLVGEGEYLNVLGIINIAGGRGYDFAIIPLIEALGLSAKTEVEYNKLVSGDTTQLLGYILERVASLVNRLLDKPVDTLLTILPNLAYFISNHGLLLTVKNLIAPVYPVLDTVLGLLGIDIEKYLKLEKVLSDITIGIELGSLGKYNLTLPDINWKELAQCGADYITDITTARSNPGLAGSAQPYANSFKKNLLPDKYYAYANADDDKDGTINKYDADAFKVGQTTVIADKGDTLIYVLTFVFEVFSTEANREALIQWICDAFDLQGSSADTVRHGVNQLFKQADAYNAPDLVVSALVSGLGIAITVDAGLNGNMAQIQTIFKDLFGAIAKGSTNSYGSIARVMQQLTNVWEDTIGSEEDFEDAKEEVEETLNWFQRIIKKIKDFFNKIFGVFKR